MENPGTRAKIVQTRKVLGCANIPDVLNRLGTRLRDVGKTPRMLMIDAIIGCPVSRRTKLLEGTLKYLYKLQEQDEARNIKNYEPTRVGRY